MAAITQVRILVTALFCCFFLQKRQKVKDALQKYDLIRTGKSSFILDDSDSWCIHKIVACAEMLGDEHSTQGDASKTEPEKGNSEHQEPTSAPLKPVVQYQTQTKCQVVTVSTIPQLDSSTNWTELISRTDGELEL